MTRPPDPRVRPHPGAVQPQFGNIAKHSLRPRGPVETDYEQIQHSADFRLLRRRFRGFVFPVTLLALAWYFTYAALGAFAEEFMSRPLFGSINVGILMGFLQFVSTAVLTVLYGRYVRKRIDPLVDELRNQERPAR